MSQDDWLNPADLTMAELNAVALADAELNMLAELVAMRRAKGLTQDDVAAVIGRNKSAVSRFEKLDSDPRLSTVRRYARAIGALIEHQVSDFESTPEAVATVDEPASPAEFAFLLESAIDVHIGQTSVPLSDFSAIRSMFGEAAGAAAAQHFRGFLLDDGLLRT